MNKKIITIISVAAAVLIIAAVTLLVIFNNDTEPANASVSSDISSSWLEAPSSSDEVSSDPISSDEVSSEPEKKQLTVTNPTKDLTVYSAHITVTGSGDPELPLYINGQEISTNVNGVFSHTVELSPGANKITVAQDESEISYTVTYKKKVISEYAPTDKLTLDGGAKLTVRVRALAGSTVTAAFNGTTITLSEDRIENDEEYSDYFGQLVMPISYSGDKNYGKITFKAVSSFGTETANGSSITVRRTIRYDDEGYEMPTGGNYIDVGHTFVAEVVCRSAETFNATDYKDLSRPTNNYLPKGTVDYCSPVDDARDIDGTIYKFRTLRYGKQCYISTANTGQNLQIHDDMVLPDTNKVNIASFSSDGRHTTLTLDVDWKAPFYFDLLPQKYRSDGKDNLDYTISAATYTHIDITFCYAEELLGEIDLTDNKIFSKYEIIENESDYTLRLYLKKQGKFYGWSAEYNEQGQLVFSFLNPATLVAADNEYGYSLEGITILIDAGHGGRDIGAIGPDHVYTEAELNLLLAKKLQTRLEALGATVYMTRTDDSYTTAAERVEDVRNVKPDYIISIHRNAFTSSSPRAFNSYHFNAFSADAAKFIYEETENKSLYELSRWSGVEWHYFFLARCTEAPSVLTENGYITNSQEYAQITDDEFNNKCSDALVDGIFAYFKSIQ